jgi:hypothetical protein
MAQANPKERTNQEHSRGILSLSPRGRGQGAGVPLIRLDAESHLATFSLRGRRKKGWIRGFAGMTMEENLRVEF